LEVDRYSAASEGVTNALNDTVQVFRGLHATLPQRGSWMSFGDVDFSGLTEAYLVACVKADDNTAFAVREKNAKGKVIARFQLTVKSEITRPGAPAPFRRDQSGQWLTITMPLEDTPKGVADLVVTCEDKAVSVDWLQFRNRQQYFTPVPKNAVAAQPDERGFIRRWRLMQPIKQDIRSNVVFTNSWLRQTFAEAQTAFANRKNKWYSMEATAYNMKLFHFAEQYGSQPYGNLFCCETVIDAPQDIENVRLAAGSNGASMWWLNGEEVLLLEGDRRMVVDDGVSPRLNLRKGQNVLRCAVVNGPGLSDMCVRFIDEKGTPVTNINIR
jgi:hypothetical protein